MPESKSGALPTWLYPYEKKEEKFDLVTSKIVDIYDIFIISFWLSTNHGPRSWI